MANFNDRFKPHDQYKEDEYQSKTSKRENMLASPDVSEQEKEELRYSQAIDDAVHGKLTAEANDISFYNKNDEKSDKQGSTSTYSGALSSIAAYDKSLPGDKSSKWLTMVDKLFTQIAGDKFSYDAKSDPRYALADEYAQRAMENQIAESAILSGGYGNSYAAATGQQVYTDYMNEAVNDMEDRAYNIWSNEHADMYNQLGVAMQLEQQEYNRAQTERQWQYQTEQDAKEDAETKKTNAQSIVYDYIRINGSIDGLSEEELAATGWSDAYINALVTEAQKAIADNAMASSAPQFTAEQALSYYVGGNQSTKVLEAMQYYFGDDYAENANAYYNNMTADTIGNTPVVDDVNPFDLSQTYKQLKAAGAKSYEDAYNFAVAAGYEEEVAKAIATGYKNSRSQVAKDSAQTFLFDAISALAYRASPTLQTVGTIGTLVNMGNEYINKTQEISNVKNKLKQGATDEEIYDYLILRAAAGEISSDLVDEILNNLDSLR